MTCSAGFTFRPSSGQDSRFSLVVTQGISDCAADLVGFVADPVSLERRAHRAGVLCSPSSLAGEVFNLVTGHFLCKVAGWLECLDDLLLCCSDIDEERCQGESIH